MKSGKVCGGRHKEPCGLRVLKSIKSSGPSLCHLGEQPVEDCPLGDQGVGPILSS